VRTCCRHPAAPSVLNTTLFSNADLGGQPTRLERRRTAAFHFYSGANSGENWINDTFNEGNGLGGYGQKIAYNAASVKVWPGTWVEIDYDNAYQAFYVPATSTVHCVNLSAATRNANYDWADGS
jgi:hypothetical protein